MTLDLDSDLQLLRRHAESWARADLDLRLDHLRNLRRRTAGVAERWVGAAARAKGLAADSPWIGEEWMSGPYALLCGINALETTLEALAAGRSPIDGLDIMPRGDDQIGVAVYPVDASERLLLSGVRAEVWMEPGVTGENVAHHVAGFYRRPAPDGRVALVLGAGNINSIAPLDVLHKLYAEGQVVMLKLNPVNAYMGPILEEIFADMAAAGWIRFAAGGAEVGAYLTAHPGIDEIHMTGSEQTFNAIVFGRGEDGERRRLAGERRNHRRITYHAANPGPMALPGIFAAALRP
jgi:aldehyde dehydrogenase (NAD(P)+)